jgi:hypothetical protein
MEPERSMRNKKQVGLDREISALYGMAIAPIGDIKAPLVADMARGLPAALRRPSPYRPEWGGIIDRIRTIRYITKLE